ncbi:MAG TPA: hypothetical protein IAC04_05145 [Candidatus Coprenecus stercoravium]|uniref:Lipoprotein n=1 Tax=Candidatus Coprenecus stercoravium TaxID=2840735 RepID=A0A9D2GPL6_9BACT|nr:hypothetical protein [Candidatus Coprenecus stercoravium]
MKRGLVLLTTLIFILSCSTSNTPTPVYDDILSNTKWVQEYIMPHSEVDSATFESLPEEIRKRLKEELLSTKNVIDTVWNVDHIKGKYTLSFGIDDQCSLEDEVKPIGTYQVRTRTRMEYHYPDQSHSYNDDIGNYLYELIVEEDTLYLKTEYVGDSINQLVHEDKAYIGHFYKYTLKDISEPYTCPTETETMHFQFIRNGHNIVLNGDEIMTGVINDGYNEINFKELGTMYLE